MHELEGPLAAMRAAFFSGRPAQQAAPKEWGTFTEPPSELALAALAGQALEVLFRQHPASELTERPLLPRLGVPTVPDAARPLVRRVVANLKTDEQRRQLVWFLLARGYTLHPADWLPSAKDDWLPEAYAAWLDWARGEGGGAFAPTDPLTAENWELWLWRERRAALTALRRIEPAAARALIVEKGPGEPPDRRLQLLTILADGLTSEDSEGIVPFLKDRSPRVQRLARRLEARLAPAAELTDDDRELAEFFSLSGGIFGKPQLKAIALKTGAQRERRAALLAHVRFTALAGALRVSESALADAAARAGEDVQDLLREMLLESGSDRGLEVLRAWARTGRMRGAALAEVAVHLSAGERLGLAARAVQEEADPTFETALAALGPELGGLPLGPTHGAGLKAVFALLQELPDETPSARQFRQRPLLAGLFALGLLVEAPTAKALLERLVAAGLSPADPSLDPLRLNAALAPENSQ